MHLYAAYKNRPQNELLVLHVTGWNVKPYSPLCICSLYRPSAVHEVNCEHKPRRYVGGIPYMHKIWTLKCWNLKIFKLKLFARRVHVFAQCFHRKHFVSKRKFKTSHCCRIVYTYNMADKMAILSSHTGLHIGVCLPQTHTEKHNSTWTCRKNATIRCQLQSLGLIVNTNLIGLWSGPDLNPIGPCSVKKWAPRPHINFLTLMYKNIR